MKTKLIIRIPANLDMDGLLSERPPLSINKFNKNHLLFIAGQVFESMSNKDGNMKNTGFVKLKALYMKSKVRNYNQYLSYLIDAKVLESDGRYINGYEAKGYKFVGQCEEYSRVTIELDIRKPNADNGKPKFGTDKLDYGLTEQLDYLTKWFADERLRLDSGAMMVELESNRRKQLDILNDEVLVSETEKVKRLSSIKRKYHRGLHIVDRIDRGVFVFGVDRKGFRLHTVLTAINRDYRKFFTFDGKPLISLDIKNCQPYLALCLFNSSFYFNPNKNNELENENNKREMSIREIFFILNIFYYHNNTYSLMWRKSFELRVRQDFNSYMEIVTAGVFYDEIEKKLLSEFGRKFNERQELKDNVLLMMYSKNGYYWQKNNEGAELKRQFKKMFPSIYEMFATAKMKDYTLLPCLLQTIESHLILRVICKRISRERPDVPLYTVHDSIATNEENKDYVLSVMTEELERNVGFAPKIKEEVWE
ncbi:MAG: hypothetical protein WCK02_00165 [Bacteroidota bacterium]